jgi:hypothetical protein
MNKQRRARSSLEPISQAAVRNLNDGARTARWRRGSLGRREGATRQAQAQVRREETKKQNPKQNKNVWVAAAACIGHAIQQQVATRDAKARRQVQARHKALRRAAGAAATDGYARLRRRRHQHQRRRA